MKQPSPHLGYDHQCRMGTGKKYQVQSLSSDGQYSYQLEEVDNISSVPPGDIFGMPAMRDHLSAQRKSLCIYHSPLGGDFGLCK